MLCSIPTSRSSPGWLDRLRASKGFPVPSDLDLDHFLRSNTNPNSNPVPITTLPDHDDASSPCSSLPRRRKKPPPPPDHKSTGEEKDQRLLDLMSNVLSEIFVMGDPRDSVDAARRSARKQLNPRPCLPSAWASADGGASCAAVPEAQEASPSSADNSVAEAKRVRVKVRSKNGATGQRANSNLAGQRANSNLAGQSGTEVTVIDTSLPGWKTEKVMFRKGVMWKVRDKKALNLCKKKRKFGLVERLVVEKERLRPLSDLKGREQSENVETQDEGFVRNDNMENAKVSDEHIQLPRRLKFVTSSRLPAKDSSVFCLQVITKNKKSWLSGLRGTLKVKSATQ